MDNILRPERLGAEQNWSNAAKELLHWKRTFRIFLQPFCRPQRGDLDELGVLTNCL